MTPRPRTVTWLGEPIAVKDLAARLNLSPATVYNRLRRLGDNPDPEALAARPMDSQTSGRLGKNKSPWRTGFMTTHDPELIRLSRALADAEEQARSLTAAITRRRKQIVQEQEARAKAEASRAKAADIERREIRARTRFID